MCAEVVEPETDGRVLTGEVVAESFCGGELEIDDAADDYADGGQQPCLANETPEDAPACSAEGTLHPCLLAALACVHQQGAKHAKSHVHREERGDENVASHLTAKIIVVYALTESIAGFLEVADVAMLRRHLFLQLLLVALYETLRIHAFSQSHDDGARCARIF